MRGLPGFGDVEAAARRIAGIARRTPVLNDPLLDAMTGAELWVKAECLQLTGSFKIRGATNRIAQLTETQRRAGVVAFSSGNHAQGVARAARLFGVPALIVMPADAPRVKIEGVRTDGAEIRLYERDKESREEIATEIARECGAVLVPSFDDPDIIAGQGTAGLELIGQMAERETVLDHLICCTGGGGLISGLSLAFAARSPATRLWTAEPEEHDDWARSLAAGQILSNPPGTRSFCDAILTPQPGARPFALCRNRLAGGLRVSDAQVAAAMRMAFQRLKLVLEPGGAVALAAAIAGLPDEMRGARIGVMLTGGNVDPALYARVIGKSGEGPTAV